MSIERLKNSQNFNKMTLTKSEILSMTQHVFDVLIFAKNILLFPIVMFSGEKMLRNRWPLESFSCRK